MCHSLHKRQGRRRCHIAAAALDAVHAPQGERTVPTREERRARAARALQQARVRKQRPTTTTTNTHDARAAAMLHPADDERGRPGQCGGEAPTPRSWIMYMLSGVSIGRSTLCNVDVEL